ncbi:RNA-directed RNA polymerase [ssRNA phage SRR5466728_4]|uniref:RNA-directed RNA polymerase n=1 Tax=ssRNA phage SRR5466728_4 TaxID=2786442 RepID=A0A8S5KYN1_9VIRU|nr:RNA-directed RNA polymerase [ssRNA phage SRR5466728_4]DAD50862.1 TPA_asm: RNA-directed RNA polymerase [ssRNA phage SRR5466728_4]
MARDVSLDSTTPNEEWMKSHVVLLGRVLRDAETQCRTSTTKDYEYILRRVEDEGLSFLTITLPTFGRDLERALDKGRVDSTLFLSFKKRASLPALMQGLTSQVFDPECGVLVANPSIEAIHAIRQVSYLFKKLELPCSDDRVRAAFEGFHHCDKEIRPAMARVNERYPFEKNGWHQFDRVARLLFWELFHNLDLAVWNYEIIPKHGPGSTAERTLANAKYDYRTWTTRLEEWFPHGDFLFPSWSHALEHEGVVDFLEPGEEPPVRVVQVPKTLKTPRIIAIEPTHMQYVQQGLMEFLVREIEGDDILSNFIGFTDQEPNRTMACHGSFHLDLATLDLSEASDRVSTEHVGHLFGDNHVSREAVFACRSPKALIPLGNNKLVYELQKYASMGSALTFPLEAMVFLTTIFVGIENALKTRLSKKLLAKFFGKVRVYGDDIIVPVEFVESVITSLEAYGFKVNQSKSFWTGRFRESCGGDFYDGVDVSVVKATREIPSSRKHVQEIISTVSLRNQFYECGYWQTANYLEEQLRRLIPFPTVWPDSPGLGRHSYLDYEVQRECPYLQRDLVKAAVVVSRTPHSPVSGVGALLKWFLKRGDEPFADRNHLERAGRPEVLDIKLRWVTPY